MTRATIYARTEKGGRLAASASRELANDLRKVLNVIDGLSSVDELQSKANFRSVEWLERALTALVTQDLICEAEASTGALDFTSMLSTPPTEDPQAKAAREAAERAKQEAEQQARKQAEEKARHEAAERAKQEAEQQARKQAEEKARHEAAERAKQEAEQQARKQAEEKVRHEAAERAKQEAEQQARKQAEEKARYEAAERAKQEAEQQARKQAEEQELKLAAERAKQEAEQQACKQTEEQELKLAAERVHRKAAERASQESEEQARKKAEEELRLASERVRQRAAEQARREAEEQARRDAEEQARKQAEEQVRKQAEEERRIHAVERARQETEEQARKLAEEQELRKAAERAREEAEQQTRKLTEDMARRDAEEKTRREAEEIARREAEERLRREAEEKARHDAEEKIRREVQEKARREAEEMSRRENEEKARRETEEKVRKEDEEKARREVEATARREIEEKARREEAEGADREADRTGREAEARERMATEEKTWREAEEKFRREEDEANAKRHKKAAAKETMTSSPRLPKWTKAVALIFAALLIIVPAILHLVSFDGQISQFEKVLAGKFQQPVKIQALYLSLLPEPHLRLEGISIGSEGQIKIQKLKAMGSLGNLFNEKKLFKSVELDSPVLTEEGLGWILFGKASAGGVVFGPVSVLNGNLQSKNFSFPAFEAKLQSDGDGTWKTIIVESTDKNFSVNLAPKDRLVQIDFKARSYRIPFGSNLTLEELTASATADGNELSVMEFKGFTYGGILSGSARLKWGAQWSLSGKLNAKQIDTSRLFPELVDGGRLVGAATYAMQAPQAAGLFPTIRLQGEFIVARGSLLGVDLGRMLQGGGISGTTRFTELAGDMVHDRGATQLKPVRLTEGAMTATGMADVDANSNVRGRFAVDIKMSGSSRQASITLGGNLKKIEWRR